MLLSILHFYPLKKPFSEVENIYIYRGKITVVEITNLSQDLKILSLILVNSEKNYRIISVST